MRGQVRSGASLVATVAVAVAIVAVGCAPAPAPAPTSSTTSTTVSATSTTSAPSTTVPETTTSTSTTIVVDTTTTSTTTTTPPTSTTTTTPAPGQQVIGRTDPGNVLGGYQCGGYLSLQPDLPDYIVPAGTWSIVAVAHTKLSASVAEQFRVAVLRPFGTGGTAFTVVALSPTLTAPSSTDPVSRLTLATPLPVQAGDILGIVSFAGTYCQLRNQSLPGSIWYVAGGTGVATGTNVMPTRINGGIQSSALNLQAELRPR